MTPSAPAAPGPPRPDRIPSVRVPLLLLSAAAILLAWAVPADAQSLRGSRASLDRQNDQARAHGFTYLDTPEQVRGFVQQGYLVPVGATAHMDLHRVSFPYARPEVRVFLERLASQYHAACGEKLVVTSLTRPRSNQPPNASSRSVHPTGMAIDLRRSGRAACREWLESTLLSLEGRGLLEAIYERNPPHYHLALYPRPYAEDLARRTGNPAVVTQALANGPSVEARWITHRVARGETLTAIAGRYETSVARIRSENGIPGSRILVGQNLRIPLYAVAEAPRTEAVAAEARRTEVTETGDGGYGEDGEDGEDGEEPGFASGAGTGNAEAAGDDSGSGASPSGTSRARTHTVIRGETLWAIARRYGVSEGEVRTANALSGNRILAGQELRIPGGGDPASSVPRTHTVRRGETLWSIARVHGVTEDALRRVNGIRGSRILPGQELALPGTGAANAVVEVTVRAGESLWAIAQRYGLTVEELQRRNGIDGARLHVGQTLTVPLMN